MTPPTLGSVTVTCYVGVGIESRFVEIYQLGAFCLAQVVVLDSLRYLAAKSVMEQAALIARTSHGLTDSGAANHFLDEIPVFVDVNLCFVGSAEQVVIVSHHFLICADQHESNIVSLVRIELVQLKYLLDVVQIDELVDDPV